MAEAAIETRGLSKTYPNGVQALVDLDLRVERGEVFGPGSSSFSPPRSSPWLRRRF